MEPDANVAEKANIKQFLQDFCLSLRVSFLKSIIECDKYRKT